MIGSLFSRRLILLSEVSEFRIQFFHFLVIDLVMDVTDFYTKDPIIAFSMACGSQVRIGLLIFLVV